eukprot:Opistho-2@71686
MSIPADFVPLYSYYVTKHSWRGKYKRIFTIGNTGVQTLDPKNWESTNYWPYGEEIGDINPGKNSNEFIVFIKKGKKKQEFSTDYRDQLLTDAQRFRHLFSNGKRGSCNKGNFSCLKLSWNEKRIHTILSPAPYGIEQLSPSGDRVIGFYDYRGIDALTPVSDVPGSLVINYGGCGRLHFFVIEKRDEFIRALSDCAGAFIGFHLGLSKKTLTVEEYRNNRFGKYSDDDSITSMCEFTVNKLTPRSHEPVPRIFCLSEVCLIERDPATYNIVCCRPLVEIYAVIRSQTDVQKFTIEYKNGAIRHYLSIDRDGLLATLLDSVRSSGNRDCCLKMVDTQRGLRAGPLQGSVPEEIEALCLKTIGGQVEANGGMTFEQAVHAFNTNVDYSGLHHAETGDGFFAENKEKLITTAIQALLTHGEQLAEMSTQAACEQFEAIRRLVASKAGFDAFTRMVGFREKLGRRVVQAFKKHEDAVAYAAVDAISALMSPMYSALI